jgi:hypothetical protein
MKTWRIFISSPAPQLLEVTGAIKCDRPDHRSSAGRFIGKDLENKDHGSGIARLSVERDK